MLLHERDQRLATVLLGFARARRGEQWLERVYDANYGGYAAQEEHVEQLLVPWALYAYRENERS